MDGDTGGSLRVLHVITDRDRRGAQIFAVDLAEGLREIGAHNEVIALSGGRHDDLMDVRSLGPSRRSLKTFRALRRHARTVDVVVAHGSATLLACSLSLLGTGVPFVYRQISDPRHWAASWSRRLRVALLLRRTSAIVALSSSAAMVFSAHYRLSSDRITVLPNAVRADRFAPATPPERAQARDLLGLDPNEIVVAYVGALAVEKGVEDLLEAVRCLPHVRVLVAGDGPHRQALERCAATLGPGQVVLTGALSDPAYVLRAVDLVALPSRGGDSMPAVLIESGLCGLPSISTPVGVIPEVVIDGETGLITPVGDVEALAGAVRRLADDPAMRFRMGDAARRHCAGNFSIRGTAPAWKALLTSITRRTAGVRVRGS